MVMRWREKATNLLRELEKFVSLIWEVMMYES